jgi:alpha-tubulin suppressor-like RCC1 family protein
MVVWAWGENISGQLGDGTTANLSTPVQVSGLSGLQAIAAGGAHSLALKADGTVWAWGDNSYDQLGDGTTFIDRNTPAQVSSLSGVKAIAAGGAYSLALKADGTVWAWGEIISGQLGDGTTANRSTPVQVSGLSGVKAIAAGDVHSLALKADGTVWAWGDNSHDQLGDGTTTNRNTPVQVSSLSGVKAIAAGRVHSLALKEAGTVWAWGDNSYDQLGRGTTIRRGTPVLVSGLSGVKAIAAGYNHSLALLPQATRTATPTRISPQATRTATPTKISTQVTSSGTCAHVTVDQFDTCVRPSVLRVVGMLPGGQLQAGTAFVIRSDATGTYLATNQHVVEGVSKAALTVYLPDGRRTYRVAAVLARAGMDGTVQDLAVIKLKPTALHPLPWGDSNRLHSLDQVVAIGYADANELLGPPSTTLGYISTTQRDLGPSCGGPGWIQHNAPIYPGNSGGPLLDLQGEVVGINTLISNEDTTCQTQGQIGFAIPSATARPTLGTLLRLLPGVQGGLVTQIGSETEIGARHIPSKSLSLPPLRFSLPRSWRRATANQFSSRDGRVTMTFAAHRYPQTPTDAQLQSAARRLLPPNKPFGVASLAFGDWQGIAVSVLPTQQRYRGDVLALVDDRDRVEVTILRLVQLDASLADDQEADTVLQSLIAVP